MLHSYSQYTTCMNLLSTQAYRNFVLRRCFLAPCWGVELSLPSGLRRPSLPIKCHNGRRALSSFFHALSAKSALRTLSTFSSPEQAVFRREMLGQQSSLSKQHKLASLGLSSPSCFCFCAQHNKKKLRKHCGFATFSICFSPLNPLSFERSPTLEHSTVLSAFHIFAFIRFEALKFYNQILHDFAATFSSEKHG